MILNDKGTYPLLLSRMKELSAFYQRMSEACINKEIAHNYRIRAEVVSTIIEQMLEAKDDSAQVMDEHSAKSEQG